jgi:hypothetical protein
MKLGSGLVSLKEVTVYSRKFFVIGVGFAVIVFAGAAVLSGCGGEQEKEKCSRAMYEGTVAGLLRQWDKVTKDAYNTPLADLSGSIEDMQSLRLEAGSLDIPGCAVLVHFSLTRHMDEIIDGFSAAEGLASEEVVKGHFDEADRLMALWAETVEMIGE